MKKIILITLITIIGLFAGCNKPDFSKPEITVESGIKYIEYNNIIYRIDGNKATILDIIDRYENIHIPEKVSSYPVTDIEDSCWFGYLSEERSLTIDTKNQYFYDDGEALYSSDKTKLYYVHNYSLDKKESYNLSKNVKWIRQNAFEYFRQKVTVDSENKYFCVYDDALYDYDMKRLLYYFSTKNQNNFNINIILVFYFTN